MLEVICFGSFLKLVVQNLLLVLVFQRVTFEMAVSGGIFDFRLVVFMRLESWI